MSRNYHVKDKNCGNCGYIEETGDDTFTEKKCKLPNGPEWATDTINFLWPWELPEEQVCVDWQKIREGEKS